MTHLLAKPAEPIAMVLLCAACFAGLHRRATASAPLPAGAIVERNVAYGSDPAQKMDVYRPANAKDAPVLLMVHGGGWRRGDKDARGVVNNKVAHWLPQGFIFISINYRMIPKANPLQQADEVGKALAYAQEHAQSWGGDPARFILMGHSAGAHLVSLVSADPAIATGQGARPWLGTISLDSAAYNVVTIMEQPHFRLYDEAFGTNHDLWQQASPILRLKAKTVPMLLVCSSRRLTSHKQADAFAGKLKELGSRATVLPLDLSHGEINARLGLDGEYTTAVDAFIKSLTPKP